MTRLNKSEPPPGYVLEVRSYEEGSFWRFVPSVGLGARGEIRAEVLAAAWAHYQERNDPPGSATWSAERRAAAWARYWQEVPCG